jgi:hypothetical protein
MTSRPMPSPGIKPRARQSRMSVRGAGDSNRFSASLKPCSKGIKAGSMSASFCRVQTRNSSALKQTSGQAEVFDQPPTFNSTAPNPNNTQLLRPLYHCRRLCELYSIILTSSLLVHYAKSCAGCSRRHEFTAGIT